MDVTVTVKAGDGSTKQLTVPGVTVNGGTPMPVGTPGTAQSWTLAFEDEFSGTSLDTSKWSSSWFNTGGTMNNVSTSAANVAVGGGHLVLTLASSSTGALISSNPKGGAGVGYQFTTGYAEARISFPGDSSGHLYNWPAWWTDGQSWPTNGENDIAEVMSGQLTVNYHSGSGSHNQGAVAGSWANSWHTYGLWRKGSTAEVYWDGNLVKSYATDDASAPQYLILNVGDGGSPNIYGPASQVLVDYVRAWQ